MNQQEALAYGRELKRIPLIDRISLDEKTGCWNWRGPRNAKGYGRVYYTGKNRQAHRLAAHLWLGFDLDSPLQVLHKCDNPACFKPKHLFVGTALDNTQDMIAKGRMKWPAKKDVCAHGHPYDESNTYFWNGRKLGCKECRRTNVRNYRGRLQCRIAT